MKKNKFKSRIKLHVEIFVGKIDGMQTKPTAGLQMLTFITTSQHPEGSGDGM